MVKFKPLPKLPEFNYRSPRMVIVLDKIRFELEKDRTNDYSEVVWFLREYPRIFRHHIECAEYRLKNIYNIYESAYKKIIKKIKESNEDIFEYMISGYEIKVLYWEFESLLSSINISLDIISRILSVAFKEEKGATFNKFCKINYDNKYINIFKEEKVKWVSKLKDYRDCFTHYTVVDTLLSIVARKYNDH